MRTHSSTTNNNEEALREVYEQADMIILNGLKESIAKAQGLLVKKLETLGVEFDANKP